MTRPSFRFGNTAAIPYALAFLWLIAGQANAQQAVQDDPREPPGTLLSKVAFDQNLDAALPLDASFRDEQGRNVRLGDYFGKRPVLLMLVYYRCPLLCGQELTGLARSLKPLALELGEEFEIVTVSIDPTEGPQLASDKKAVYLEKYGRPGAEKGWHFLTGDESSIARLTSTVGFRYTYNPTTKLYAHAAGLVVCTPEGRTARYFYGSDFPPRDLQFAAMEASNGKIGSPMAQALLFCYEYDAATGKYTLAILRLLQVAGTATALAVAVMVATLWYRDRRKQATKPLSTHLGTLLE